jgi:UDP-N-acetylmuramoylalanine--D-glutamate ligase
VTATPRGPQTGTDLRDRTVVVAGLGVTGPSVVRALLGLGARVVAVDGRDRPRERDVADELTALGATVRLGDGTSLPDGAELVVTSPGWRPDSPLLVAATDAGLEVWGDVELAYRLRPPGQEWLGVTGTNGKTTTVQMLASILRAAGHHAVATGNVGFPVLDAVLADPPYDVLAVEVSSFQLHWTTTVAFISGAVLNIAPDHLDWHGSLEDYAAEKALVWRSDWYAVYNADDPLVAALAQRVADRQDFSLDRSGRHCFGLAGDLLVDRCIGTDPHDAEVERAPGGGVVIGHLSDIPVPGQHNVANALAAAALARALNSATGSRLRVRPRDVALGLRAFDPGPHRIAHVATVDGVEYVDDSKATNAHAAAASLSSYPSVVWIAGGLAKGGTFDELVTTARDRLRGAVLIGADRAVVAQALARHAPEIPVVEVERTDTGAMEIVVREAARLAQRGDTVLLAPACASMDMFRDYAERGDAFAAAVRQLRGAGEAAGPAS